MKTLMRLTLIVMLLAPNAYAFGSPGSTVVDIVGSKTDNTRIETSGTGTLDLEFVGSLATNITIASPKKTKRGCFGCPCPEFLCPEKKCSCPDGRLRCDGKCCAQNQICSNGECTPINRFHLGVDAWNGAFWFMDSPNMPKWPRWDFT